MTVPTWEVFRSLLPWLCVVVLGLFAVASYLAGDDQ